MSACGESVHGFRTYCRRPKATGSDLRVGDYPCAWIPSSPKNEHSAAKITAIGYL